MAWLEKSLWKMVFYMSVMSTGEGPQKAEFSLAVDRIVSFQWIDHQKMCMTSTGYNQELVIIDHYTKNAEGIPCLTASADEIVIFYLVSGLLDMSARSYSSHPNDKWHETNDLIQRHNRTLDSVLRIFFAHDTWTTGIGTWRRWWARKIKLNTQLPEIVLNTQLPESAHAWC